MICASVFAHNEGVSVASVVGRDHPIEGADRRTRMDERTQLRQKIQAARDEATAALAALQGGSTMGRDLYKQVTGHSSVDNAVAEARRIIDAYDRILRDLDSGVAPTTQMTIHVLGSLGGRAVVA